MSALAEWDSFYVIVGSAAGGLIGLQFVVMTLIAERPTGNLAAASAAFASPTVVHLSVVLLLALLMRVPWHATAALSWVFGSVSGSGLVYIGVVIRRFVQQRAYRPQAEDWVFHVVLPLAAFVSLAIPAFLVARYEYVSLLAAAAAAIALLFASIHNMWDAVVYHVVVQRRSSE